MYGSAGTGKTLILCEALKIKLSQLLSQGRRVRILATTFDDQFTAELLDNFSSKYFVNMKNIEVMSLSQLCRDLNITYDPTTPRNTVNQVITSLSDKETDIVTLLVVDEVLPSGGYQKIPDWRDLEVRENVIWLLALSPTAGWGNSTQIFPPVKPSVLTRHLVHKHRNCPQIRNLIKTSPSMSI